MKNFDTILKTQATLSKIGKYIYSSVISQSN